MQILNILRKNWPIQITPILIKDLDKSKCSKLFLERHLASFKEEDTIYVKCDENGTLDLREKSGKLEYRIINPKWLQV